MIGVLIESHEEHTDMFEEKELHLKEIKSEARTNKPRKTISKLVSGKELTSDDVCSAMKDHEKNQPRPVSLSKNPTSKKIISKPHTPISVKPKQGPSHINLLLQSSDSSEDDDDIPDKEKCCFCGLFTPKEKKNEVFISFTKWAQCDGMPQGKPCLHWVHLKYCTKVSVLRRGDKFFCHHCETVEE
jgi:hypothetical protein